MRNGRHSQSSEIQEGIYCNACLEGGHANIASAGSAPGPSDSWCCAACHRTRGRYHSENSLHETPEQPHCIGVPSDCRHGSVSEGSDDGGDRHPLLPGQDSVAGPTHASLDGKGANNALGQLPAQKPGRCARADAERCTLRHVCLLLLTAFVFAALLSFPPPPFPPQVVDDGGGQEVEPYSEREYLDELQTLSQGGNASRRAIQQIVQVWGKGESLFTAVPISNFIGNGTRARIVGKMARSILLKSVFRVGVLGTSVTAGHDDFFNQSWPMVLQSVMAPALTASGVSLAVRNHAMGNNGLFPSHLCAIDTVGDDLDVLAWEFAMIYFPREGWHCGGEALETLMRSVFLSRRSQPAILLVPSGIDDLRKEEQQAKNASCAMKQNARLYDRFECGKSDTLQAYAQFGLHEVFVSPGPHCNDKDMSWDRLQVGGKPTHKNAPWHPGPQGHALVAHFIAYEYLHMWLEALAHAQSVLREASSHAVPLSQFRRLVMSFSSPLSPSESVERVPARLSDERVRSGVRLASILGAAIGNVSSASTIDEVEFDRASAKAPLFATRPLGLPLPLSPCLMCDRLVAPRCAMEHMPHVGPNISSLRSPQSTDTWSLRMPSNVIHATDEAVAEGRVYLDKKYMLSGTHDQGILRLVVSTTVADSPLIVCRAICEWGNCPEEFVNPDAPGNVTFTLDGAQLPTPKNDDKRFGGSCWRLGTIRKAGEHQVTVQTMVQAPDRYFGISHVIWW